MSFLFLRSLRGRLMVVLLSLTAMPALLIGGLAYHNARQTIETRVLAQLTAVADLKKEQLTTWLVERVADARLLGQNYLNEEHFTVILDHRADLERRLAFAGFLTDNLISLRETRRGYRELVFVDAAGRVVLSTDRSHLGASLIGDRAVSMTLASRTGEHIQDIRRGDDGRFEMVFGHVLHAVDRASGKILPEINGAVVIRVTMEDSVFPLISTWPGKGLTGETLLTRREGENVVFLNPLRFSEGAPLALRVRDGAPNASAQLAAHGREGIVETPDYRGVPVLAAYRSIPQTGWGFVAKLDAAEAFAPVTQLTRLWLAATALVLLAAGAAAVSLSRALTRPLARLVKATRSVAAGDFDGEVDVVRQDEIGSLAASFRSMIEAVRRRNADLRARAEELSSLLDLSGRFAGLLDPNQVMETALTASQQMIPGDCSAILMLDKDGENLSAHATRGWPAGLAELRFRVGRESAAGYAVAQKTPVLVDDTEAETRFEVPPVVRRLGIRSVLAVPMLLGDRSVGALWTLSRRLNVWDDERIQLAALIANQTAVALERAHLFRDLGDSYDRTLDALAAALDARDRETEGHSRRVVAYTLALARQLRLPEAEWTALQHGALLHDIGKIGVPDAILLKPGPLTEAEWVVMRRHPGLGARILSGIPFLDAASRIVRTHQERWDGGGYPDGLRGEDITLGARIFAVADAFDAITSDRPYRPARFYAEARAEIEAGSGTQFDPRVVAAFLQIPEGDWTRLWSATVSQGAAAGFPWPLALTGARAAEVDALNRLISAVAGSLDLEELLREATRATVESFGAAATGFFLHDPETDSLTLVAEAGLPDQLKARFSHFPVAGFHNELVVREGRPRIHGSPSDIPEFAALGLPTVVPGWGTYLCVPLTAKGDVKGVMGIFSRRSRMFDRYDVALFQAIGEQVGRAVVNARLHESVRQMAITDGLTGAHNRRYLDHFLPRELQRCAQARCGISLVMLDLDNFKTYNDAYGHPAGDDVLRQVTQGMRATVRTSDVVVRYGGDEFVLVLSGAEAEVIRDLANRVQQVIAHQQFAHGRVTASAGVAHCAPDQAMRPEELIAMADQALYNAKRNGGNRVCVWDVGLIVSASQTRAAQNGDPGELVARLQPGVIGSPRR